MDAHTILDRQISTGGHLVRLSVERARDGWDLREELDSTTTGLRHYGDWHRLDRAVKILEMELGWQGISALRPH